MLRGGTVFYRNYLGTNTKVTQTYMTKTDANNYMNGKLSTNVARSLFGFAIGVVPGVNALIGGFLLGQSISDSFLYNYVRKKNGCLMVMQSEDHDGRATVKIHWNTAPAVIYYDNAILHVR